MHFVKLKNEVLKNTYQERLKIGFDNVKEGWQLADPEFTADSLKICGHPVMESWEDNYMKILAKIASANNGVVLEVGFGLGISANYIQQFGVCKHIIIEANKKVFEKAEIFIEIAKSEVELIFGFWEDVTKKISDNSFDGILFDTYPLTPEDVHKNHFCFFQEAHRLLKPGGILTYYSDEVDSFSQKHVECLRNAGFYTINEKICKVSPPQDCQYWESKTILAPIIIK